MAKLTANTTLAFGAFVVKAGKEFDSNEVPDHVAKMWLEKDLCSGKLYTPRKTKSFESKGETE